MIQRIAINFRSSSETTVCFLGTLTLFMLLLSSCSKKIEVVEHVTPPVANFTYSLNKLDNQMQLRLKSHSLNASSWKWTIDSIIEATDENTEILLEPAASYHVRLEVWNPAGNSVSERTIYFSETSQTPAVKGVSYSWWCDPISIYHQSNNYFSGVDSLGQQVIYCYNLDHNRLTSRHINGGYRRDEHNSPAFIVHDNGILTAFTGHDEDRIVRLKRLSLNLDAEGPTRTVTFPSSTSYTQLFTANGRIFLTTRCISRWFIAWSDNGGESWSEPVPFFQKNTNIVPGAFYIRPVVVGPNRIAIGSYMHPTTAGDKLVLYYANFNPQTGDISKENGNVLGNIYGNTGKTVNIEQLDTIYAATTGNTFRFLDIALQNNGKTAFLVATTSTSNYTTGDYAYIERDHETRRSSQITIVPHGNDLPHDTYWGGAYFVIDRQSYWNNTIYLAREDKRTWYVEKYTLTGQKFEKTTEVEKYDSKDNRTLSRPIPPIGSTEGGLAVIYQKGEYYDYPSYMNWRKMELKLVAPSPTATSLPEVHP